MATWVAVKITGSGEPSYINADQVAYVRTGNQNCQVNFEGDADKIVNSMGGAAFDAARS